MRIEIRKRAEPQQKPQDLPLSHNDIVVIMESVDESRLLDALGNPGTKFVGEIRLADGYGEHYLLIQPTHVVGDDWERDIPVSS